jgi:hypothetical protein
LSTALDIPHHPAFGTHEKAAQFCFIGHAVNTVRRLKAMAVYANVIAAKNTFAFVTPHAVALAYEGLFRIV